MCIRDRGAYGPYRQSNRKEIYHIFAKSLVEKGFAYPCFCSAETLDEVRKAQEAEKKTTGYYGEYAHCRKLSLDEIKAGISEGRPYVLRLRSPGKEDGKVYFDDVIKGKIEMPENTQDIVLLKTDGIPTYHFAHAVDDHLMGTTHVVRGDEWIASAPIHLQLFRLLGFKAPKYAHIAPLMKEENGGDVYKRQAYPMMMPITAEIRIMIMGCTFLSAIIRAAAKRTAATQNLRVAKFENINPAGKKTASAKDITAEPISPTTTGLRPFIIPLTTKLSLNAV